MEDGLLSLKWNNHKLTFINLFQLLRKKGSCTDATISCGQKFFNVHKLILMACSEFFYELFEHITCQNPIVVLNDVTSRELEALLDYMYLGEVEVQQKHLPGIIKVAENLRIKGLAVPDEQPMEEGTSHSRSQERCKERLFKRKRSLFSDSLNEDISNSNPIQTNLKSSRKSDLCDDNNQISCSVKSQHDTGQITSENITDNESIHSNKSETQSAVQSKSEISFQHVGVKLEDFPPLIEEPFIKLEGEDNSDINSSDFQSNSISTRSDDVEDYSSNNILALGLAGPSRMEASEISFNQSENSSSSVDPQHFSIPNCQLFGDSSVLDKIQNSTTNPSVTATFKCPYCSRVDFYESKWKRHLLTHTGEKPFPCPYCHYRATTKHCVLRHIKFKHAAVMS